MIDIKEDIKNITIYEEPETKEALNLLNNAIKKNCFLIIISIISFLLACLSLIYLIHAIQTKNEWNGIVLVLILFITSLITFILYFCIINPYKKLYKIAQHNDTIRNDEQIRFRERKRLEQMDKEQKETITNEQIDNTLNKLDIQTNKKIKKLPPKPLK